VFAFIIIVYKGGYEFHALPRVHKSLRDAWAQFEHCEKNPQFAGYTFKIRPVRID
jgi:hypothetical protein